MTELEKIEASARAAADGQLPGDPGREKTKEEIFREIARKMGHTRQTAGAAAAPVPPAGTRSAAKSQRETGNASNMQRKTGSSAQKGNPETVENQRLRGAHDGSGKSGDGSSQPGNRGDEKDRREEIERKVRRIHKEIRAERARAASEAVGKARIARTKPNKYENAFMLDMMILRNSLSKRRESVRDRLKQVNPHAWRDLQLLFSLVCRIQEQLRATMPESRDAYYQTIAQHGRYCMQLEGPIRQERTVVITDVHLGAILDAAIKSECLMCVKDGREIDRCPLRQAMLEVAPPEKVNGDGAIGCEYRDVPGQILREETVVI